MSGKRKYCTDGYNSLNNDKIGTNRQFKLEMNLLPRFSNYDTASILVKTSQLRPVKGKHEYHALFTCVIHTAQCTAVSSLQLMD
jgi:hypothetical protein